MFPEWLAVLAGSGASALVAAAGTDAWNSAKTEFGELLSKSRRTKRPEVDHRLDQVANEVSAAGQGEIDAVRQRLAGEWRTHLTDLLHEQPGLAAELQIATSKVTDRLSRRPSVTQSNRAEGNATQYNTMYGSIHVHTPPAVKEKLKSRRLIHFFMAGCGVGNRIAILPMPAGHAGSEETGFAEFMEALKGIGLPSERLSTILEIERVMRSGGAAEGEALLDAHMRYFKFMNDLVADARNEGIPEEFQWFTVGRLLYEIVTVSILGASVERTAGIERRALAHVAPELEMPEKLQNRIIDFATIIQADNDELMARANELALECHAIL